VSWPSFQRWLFCFWANLGPLFSLFLVDILGECDYTTLKTELELTDGHMSTHMKKLVDNEYIQVTKEFVKNKPQTTYCLTRIGRNNFKKYVEFLKELIAQ
jgi:predicted ArsR family transcriptional regulator